MSIAKLTWTLPTTRTDGSDLSPDDIASVDVFDDVADGNGAQKVGSVTGAGTGFNTGTLAVGTHTFTIVVNDTTGHKSGPSNPASGTVAPTQAAPSAVSDLQVTIEEQ